MAARDLPITGLGDHLPVGRITINDNFEDWASKGMRFVISPVLVSQHGTKNNQVIEFTIAPIEASENKLSLMADNQIVKEL